MSVAINSFLYHLPYDDIFGGVSAMTVDHFRYYSKLKVHLRHLGLDLAKPCVMIRSF